jgi:hypothetical protein
MKILHIQRSKPDETVRTLIRETSKGNDAMEVALFVEAVDYHRLVDEIFASDRVISWW